MSAVWAGGLVTFSARVTSDTIPVTMGTVTFADFGGSRITVPLGPDGTAALSYGFDDPGLDRRRHDRLGPQRRRGLHRRHRNHLGGRLGPPPRRRRATVLVAAVVVRSSPDSADPPDDALADTGTGVARAVLLGCAMAFAGGALIAGARVGRGTRFGRGVR